MKRKTLIITAVCMTAFVLAGCGSKGKVAYPEANGNGARQLNIPDRIEREVTNAKGKVLCSFDADVIADTSAPFPVYGVVGRTYTDEDLKKICDSLFDDGSYSVLLPICCSGSDYLTQRSNVISDRQSAYVNAGEEVPRAVEEEIKLLDKQGRDGIPAEQTTAFTGEVKWYDINPYLKANYKEDNYDLRFCYVEGKIDGELFKVNFTDYLNCVSIIGYKPISRAEGPDEFNLLYTTGANTVAASSGKNPDSECDEIKKRLGVSDYSLIGECDANVFGGMSPKGKPYREAQGVVKYFAADVNGKTRPLEYNYDSFSTTDIVLNRYIPRAEEMFNAYAWETRQSGAWYQTSFCMPKTKDGYCLGYESVMFCVSENGVESFAWASPCDALQVETEDVQLIEFDAAIDRVSDVLEFLMGTYPNAFAGKAPEINKIELGMCRITEDNIHYYMVPAWYFYSGEDVSGNPMKNSDLAINAVDGSLISVKTGGQIVTKNNAKQIFG